MVSGGIVFCSPEQFTNNHNQKKSPPGIHREEKAHGI